MGRISSRQFISHAVGDVLTQDGLKIPGQAPSAQGPRSSGIGSKPVGCAVRSTPRHVQEQDDRWREVQSGRSH